MEKIGGGAPTLLIIGAHVSIHLQYVYVIAMLIKKALHIVVLMYQLEVEKSCTLSIPLYFTELDDLYVPHIFYIRNA